MANTILNDSSSTLNLTLNQYDDLMESIAKANALMHIILSVTDLEEIPHSKLHDYLWAVRDFMHQIETICSSLT